MELLRAVHHVFRVWRRAPSVALAIITLLALGMAGVAALFGPLYSLVLSPLPFPEPDRLVRLGGGIPLFNAYTNTFDARDRLAAIFTNVIAYAPVTGVGAEAQFLPTSRPRQVNSLAVTPEFLETLGVLPRMGRSFAEEPIDSPAVVVSDRLWRTEFGASDDVIGTTIRIGRQPRPVVGVMPERFDFPGGMDVWMLMGSTPYPTGLQFVGRLRPGVPIKQGAAALERMGYERVLGPSGQFAGDGPVLQTLQAYLRGETRATLWMLWAVSGLFLLLACVGSANLLLAHGVRRRPEIVVRLALGSGRMRLVAQLLAETLVLAVVGGLLGMWLSTVADRWLQTQFPDMRNGHVFVPATLALVVGLALAVTIVCGMAPALHATRVELGAALMAHASRGGLPVDRRLLTPREWLAGLQLAVALALLIGAGLLLRSLTGQLNRPLGLQPEGVAAFRVDLPPSPAVAAVNAAFRKKHEVRRPSLPSSLVEKFQRTVEPERRAERVRNVLFLRQAYERVGALPDVSSVGVLSPTPFTAQAAVRVHLIALISPSDSVGTRKVRSGRGRASPTGFDVLGIRLVAGRAFTSEDVADTLATQMAHITSTTDGSGERDRHIGVAIVNEALAQRLWPNQNGIGKHLNDGPHSSRVVGVVSNFHWTPDPGSSGPAVYYPFTGDTGHISFVVKLRPGASLESFSQQVDQVVSELMPGLPRVEAQGMEALTEAGQRETRMALLLLGWFSLLGTIVAALGVHATSTLMGAARAREIGIRMALGASATEVRWLALSRSARALVLAMPIGLLGGWALARQLSHLLFDVAAADFVTYLTSAVVLLVVGLLAGFLPAWRAAATDPAATLRCE